MLNTLLAQIFSYDQRLLGLQTLQREQMSFHRSWTLAELLHNFRAVISNKTPKCIWFVINGLDKCDDSRIAFLNDICDFAKVTERCWKIVITSTVDCELQAALADWPTINLDDHLENSELANKNLESDIDSEVLELTQLRPEFRIFEKTLTEKLAGCGQDKQWRSLILNQLRLSKRLSTKSAIQRELDPLPLSTPKDVFTRILARVSSDRRAWARKALSWILYAFYPLSIWELGVALALEVDSLSDETMDLDELIYQHVSADLDEVFDGMFIVKQSRVLLGHPDVREFLLAADGEQEGVWYDVKETAHEQIIDACHFYLSLQQVRDYIATTYNSPIADPLESLAFIPQNNLLVYSIKYWLRHYTLLPETSRPTERTLKFFRNTKVMRYWTEAYWWSSNPIRRTDRVFLSLLPILAGHGLQDLVALFLGLSAETPASSQDYALALAEAARNAHVEVVRKLLSCGGYDQAGLQDALVAGASCCDEAVLDELVTYAAERFEKFEWPPVILCRAAQFGLENVAKKLLESGASLDTAITCHNMSPLHLASRGGNLEVAKLLLDHKASLTKPGIHGLVPLHIASIYGHEAVLKLILDAGADVNILTEDDINAMHFACGAGNYKIVKVLAEAGSKTDCIKEGSWSPLTVVANEGFIHCAQSLLKNKADIEVEGEENKTPLRYAALRGHVKLCQLLLESGANASTPRGGPPILVASAGRGKVEIVKLLVENGAAVDAVDSDGLTALQVASLLGHISVVTYLLDHGADVNHTTNKERDTSIHFAADMGFIDVAQVLIDRGADLHHVTAEGWTPLHRSLGHAKATRVLLENGADINHIANHYSPLFLASAKNYIETVEVLLSFKPDLEIKYIGQRHTALSNATIVSDSEIVRLLLEAGANVNHKSGYNNFPLQYAVVRNSEYLVRKLMEYHPDVNLVADDGNTALHSIDSSTSLKIAKRLINGGSDPEIRNNEGNTALCNAVMVQNVDIVKYLITKNAKINVVGGKYGGPLHIACLICNIELIKILIAAGADVNLVDPNMGTPLASACGNLNPDNKEMHESIIHYLTDEANADVTIVGGGLAFALNVACWLSTPDMVKLILDKSRKTNIADESGRVAIHFTVWQSLEHLQLILAAGADVEARDKMGRTALHWAAAGGVVDVIERVLSLSRGVVDQADIDDWTPLLWAARGFRAYRTPMTSNTQEEVIKFLLDRGADPRIKGKGLDREWSPVKVARYHGADDTIVQLLIAKLKSRLVDEGEEDTWDDAFHASKKARKQDDICDSCLFVSILMLSPSILVLPATQFTKHFPFNTLCVPANIGTIRTFTVSSTNARPAYHIASATSATSLSTSCIPIIPSRRSALSTKSSLKERPRRTVISLMLTAMMIQMMMTQMMTTQMMTRTRTTSWSIEPVLGIRYSGMYLVFPRYPGTLRYYLVCKARDPTFGVVTIS
jgi:ankyrin repeat protein